MWDASYGSVPTRWQALSDALMDAQRSPVLSLENKVRWGFAAYTADGNDTQGVACPILDQVPIRFGNYADIQAEYARLSTIGRPSFKAETPTGESLSAVADQLAAYSEPGPKFIIVATDGEPDDCRVHDPQCGQDLAIAAAQRAYRNGIVSFVIGIGNEVGEAHLGDLANAGRGLPVTAPSGDFINVCLNGGYATQTATYAAAGQAAGNATYYRPADPAALEAAFLDIIQSVRTCNFELNAQVDLAKAYQGSVVLDDVDLGYDVADGWRMVNETQIEIVGEACTRILSDSRRIEISFPCDVAVRLQ
jgi:hypothetical protein